MGNGKNWRLPHIGEFFIDLTLQLFGGEKMSYNSVGEADVLNYDLDTRLEVKGSGNRDAPVIKYRQLYEYLILSEFPLKYCWYAIFWYRNRWRGSHKSISTETPTKESILKFLTQNTMMAFIADAVVLDAIRRKRGIKIKKMHGEEFEIVNLGGKTYFREFEKYPEISLYQLGLGNEFEVAMETIKMKFHGNQMEFKLVMVLPGNVIPKILKIVRSRIKTGNGDTNQT